MGAAAQLDLKQGVEARAGSGLLGSGVLSTVTFCTVCALGIGGSEQLSPTHGCGHFACVFFSTQNNLVSQFLLLHFAD